MKQRLSWGLVVTMMLLVILAFAFVTFAEVIAAWKALMAVKDGYEIVQSAVNMLTGEKETLEGKTKTCKASYDREVEYFVTWGKKLADINLQIKLAEKRVKDAHSVVSNCEYQIETAERGISYSYYQRPLKKGKAVLIHRIFGRTFSIGESKILLGITIF